MEIFGLVKYQILIVSFNCSTNTKNINFRACRAYFLHIVAKLTFNTDTFFGFTSNLIG